jgi:hypothetical protein
MSSQLLRRAEQLEYIALAADNCSVSERKHLSKRLSLNSHPASSLFSHSESPFETFDPSVIDR